MDGHTTGSPQGAGGQNPAYRPAHRHRLLNTAREMDGTIAFTGAADKLRNMIQ